MYGHADSRFVASSTGRGKILQQGNVREHLLRLMLTNRVSNYL